MGPLEHASWRREAERSVFVDFHRQGTERLFQFVYFKSSRQTDGPQVMPMQSLGQPTQDRLVRIRRDAVDDQLSSGDAEYERRSLVKQTSDAAGEASNRRGERRVAPRIHRM